MNPGDDQGVDRDPNRTSVSEDEQKRVRQEEAEKSNKYIFHNNSKLTVFIALVAVYLSWVTGLVYYSLCISFGFFGGFASCIILREYVLRILMAPRSADAPQVVPLPDYSLLPPLVSEGEKPIMGEEDGKEQRVYEVSISHSYEFVECFCIMRLFQMKIRLLC
jgi:hypothetical protein